MRVALLTLVAAALAVPAAGAAEPALTPARAHASASARLLGYALGFSYVVDYNVTRCVVSGGRASCSYRIAWYGQPACTGTIAVTMRHRVATARFVAPYCEPPPEATAPPEPGPSPSPTPTPTPTPTPPPPPTPKPPPTGSGAYPGGTHSVADIATDDSLVTLDDGSRWTIPDTGRSEVDSWEQGDDVTVTAASGGGYTLTNLTLADGTAVAATYAGTG